ncbi:MAG: helix-turn-helix domain-containing protein [Oscillospiraceae bacterium]|nr:helix-turn-helix domain-containing protein [Oscillospiraceae bacterium]
MSNQCVYSVRDIANLLHISTKTVYQIVRSGELDAIWVRGQIRITQTALQTYLKKGSPHGKEPPR